MGRKCGTARAGREAPCGGPGPVAASLLRRENAQLIGPDDIEAAASRLGGHVRHTPVLRLAPGELAIAAPLALKLECLQHTGSFKPRGAFNRMLTTPLPRAGVIAASGGNHAAAVAYAARTLGVRAEIFVPDATPDAKLARIAQYGADLVRNGRAYSDALRASRERRDATGALEVHAYDDRMVIAGQGTVGREFEQDAPDLTHLCVATGGGGLIGGIAAWYAGRVELISVEPAGCPALHDALAADCPVAATATGIAADSLGAREVGSLVFPIVRDRVARAVLVSDAAILAAR
ncbi:MAG: pyridoxal-phosphate dependent enzyme, partial [Acetobacteraceae bacterium]|nr:pyridoxal-phosphate dependent enzyme [Acetobacteraceae bacterium]